MASALRGAAHSQAGRKRLKYRSLTPAADMLCLPSTTAQCRISVRCLENRPRSSSSRAPCSQNPAEGNRRPMSTPPGASLLAARSCRTLPPYQAGHRASDRPAASQQLATNQHHIQHIFQPPACSPAYASLFGAVDVPNLSY